MTLDLVHYVFKTDISVNRYFFAVIHTAKK